MKPPIQTRSESPDETGPVSVTSSDHGWTRPTLTHTRATGTRTQTRDLRRRRRSVCKALLALPCAELPAERASWRSHSSSAMLGLACIRPLCAVHARVRGQIRRKGGGAEAYTLAHTRAPTRERETQRGGTFPTRHRTRYQARPKKLTVRHRLLTGNPLAWLDTVRSCRAQAPRPSLAAPVKRSFGKRGNCWAAMGVNHGWDELMD